MKRKFKIGDKVKIISKSFYSTLEDSGVYKRGLKNGIWFITNIDKTTFDKWVYIVSGQKSERDGDYFLECDLLPHVCLLEDGLFEI